METLALHLKEVAVVLVVLVLAILIWINHRGLSKAKQDIAKASQQANDAVQKEVSK